MEPSGKKGIFVGYSETSKAYKIYVPGQRYIEVSRDVTFHEEAAFKHSKESQQDTEMEEPEEPLDQVDTMDTVEQIERPMRYLLLRGNLPGVEKFCERQKNMQLLQVLSEKVIDLKDFQVMWLLWLRLAMQSPPTMRMLLRNKYGKMPWWKNINPS
jgi:hypothetical protein